MYTWGYIKEAALAKMDLSLEQAIEMNLVNKMPFYANEAITYITSSIKAKRAYAEFDVRDLNETLNCVKEKYKLDDVSFLFKQPCDKTILSLDQAAALDEYNSHYCVNQVIKFPSDFVMWSDDPNYILVKNCFCNFEWKELEDTVYQTYNGNSLIFVEPGYYRMAYKAKWFKIYPTTSDEEELDCPDDILEAIPSYIASQLYKIDDETKSAYLRNEYEMMLARIEENDYSSNKTFHIGGGW